MFSGIVRNTTVDMFQVGSIAQQVFGTFVLSSFPFYYPQHISNIWSWSYIAAAILVLQRMKLSHPMKKVHIDLGLSIFLRKANLSFKFLGVLSSGPSQSPTFSHVDSSLDKTYVKKKSCIFIFYDEKWVLLEGKKGCEISIGKKVLINYIHAVVHI